MATLDRIPPSTSPQAQQMPDEDLQANSSYLTHKQSVRSVANRIIGNLSELMNRKAINAHPTVPRPPIQLRELTQLAFETQFKTQEEALQTLDERIAAVDSVLLRPSRDPDLLPPPPSLKQKPHSGLSPNVKTKWNQSSNSARTLNFPSEKALIQCLEANSTIKQISYLKEKGIIETVAKRFADSEISESHIDLAIRGVLPESRPNVEISMILIFSRALRECETSSEKNIKP